MTPDAVTELIKVLADAFKSIFPLLATGLVTYFVVNLKNRNDREKVETQRDKSSVDATDIINRKFEETYVRLNKTQDELFLAKGQIAEIKEKHAEERGGLKQQIADLIEQQNQERQINDQHKQSNDKVIGQLQGQIEALIKRQAELEAKVFQTASERDQIYMNLEAKIVELQRAQELLDQTQKDVIRLSEEKAELQRLLDEKDVALNDLQKQLDSPRKRKPSLVKETD